MPGLKDTGFKEPGVKLECLQGQSLYILYQNGLYSVSMGWGRWPKPWGQNVQGDSEYLSGFIRELAWQSLVGATDWLSLLEEYLTFLNSTLSFCGGREEVGLSTGKSAVVGDLLHFLQAAAQVSEECCFGL